MIIMIKKDFDKYRTDNRWNRTSQTVCNARSDNRQPRITVATSLRRCPLWFCRSLPEYYRASQSVKSVPPFDLDKCLMVRLGGPSGANPRESLRIFRKLSESPKESQQLGDAPDTLMTRQSMKPSILRILYEEIVIYDSMINQSQRCN